MAPLYYQLGLKDLSLKPVERIIRHDSDTAVLGITYTNDHRDVDAWMDRHAPQKSPFVGFDIEWKPNTRPSEDNSVALIQIATSEQALLYQTQGCYLGADGMSRRYFTINQMRSTKLKSLLADPNVFKVGVGIKDDARKLVKDIQGLVVAPILDLSEVTKLHYQERLRQALKTDLYGVMEKYSSILGHASFVNILHKFVGFPQVEWVDASRFMCSAEFDAEPERLAEHGIDLKEIRIYLNLFQKYEIQQLKSGLGTIANVLAANPKTNISADQYRLPLLVPARNDITVRLPKLPKHHRFGLKSLFTRYLSHILPLSDTTSEIAALCISDSKSVARSNWSLCPLSHAQVMYAAVDAWGAFAVLNELSSWWDGQIGVVMGEIKSELPRGPLKDVVFPKLDRLIGSAKPDPGAIRAGRSSGEGSSSNKGRDRSRSPMKKPGEPKKTRRETIKKQ